MKPISSRGRAEQTEFFANHGVNHVGVGFGQIEQLLPALHESDAQGSAGADGDLRLFDLVIGVPRGNRFFHLRANPALSYRI